MEEAHKAAMEGLKQKHAQDLKKQRQVSTTHMSWRCLYVGVFDQVVAQAAAEEVGAVMLCRVRVIMSV